MRADELVWRAVTAGLALLAAALVMIGRARRERPARASDDVAEKGDGEMSDPKEANEAIGQTSKDALAQRPSVLARQRHEMTVNAMAQAKKRVKLQEECDACAGEMPKVEEQAQDETKKAKAGEQKKPQGAQASTSSQKPQASTFASGSTKPVDPDEPHIEQPIYHPEEPTQLPADPGEVRRGDRRRERREERGEDKSERKEERQEEKAERQDERDEKRAERPSPVSAQKPEESAQSAPPSATLPISPASSESTSTATPATSDPAST